MIKRNFYNTHPILTGRISINCTGCGDKVTKRERYMSLMYHKTVLCQGCNKEAEANGGQIKIKKIQPSFVREKRPVGHNALLEYELYIVKNKGKRPKGRPPKGFDNRRIENDKFRTGLQILRERSHKRY